MERKCDDVLIVQPIAHLNCCFIALERHDCCGKDIFTVNCHSGELALCTDSIYRNSDQHGLCGDKFITMGHWIGGTVRMDRGAKDSSTWKIQLLKLFVLMKENL